MLRPARGLSLPSGRRVGPAAPLELPARLTDEEFWRLVEEFSEPNGYFRSDNLVSNEDTASSTSFPTLATPRPARRRLPRRRAGAELHLHRRAPAEAGVHHRHPARQSAAAPDVQGAVRAVGRSRRVPVAAVLAGRPAGLGPTSAAERDLRGVLDGAVRPRGALRGEPAGDHRHAAHAHGFPLAPRTCDGIDYVYGRFFAGRPGARLLERAAASARRPLSDLPGPADGDRRPGRTARYLATEENFRFLQGAAAAAT